MPTITMFPLGNADAVLVDLADGQKLLFDYADRRDPDDEDDLRCDLPKELRDDLDAANRKSYDVVTFTHLDKDHYEGASEFFYLEYAKKYQSDDRIKIDTMWVPAAVITEGEVSDSEGKVIQREARHRLIEGKGIRIFSRPERLKDWLEAHDLTLEERQHLITDAGRTVPGYSKVSEEAVEFFVHSPFARRLDDGTVEDRNDDSLVLQATFQVEGRDTMLMLAADVSHEVLADIVGVTTSKGNDIRLEWDVFKIPHHCSYLSLGPEKGTDGTDPVGEVKWLYEDKGHDRGIIVSTSKPIPEKGDGDEKDDNPPHRQAANYYRGVVEESDGEFKVTMEHPTESAPKPLVIQIDKRGATTKKRLTPAAAAVIGTPAPRAG